MKRLYLSALFLLFTSSNVFSSPVNINSADAKTIADSLDGIGISKAEAIVKYREIKGPFRTVDELDNVKGINKKTLDKIRNDILLGEPDKTSSASQKTDLPPTEPKK